MFCTFEVDEICYHREDPSHVLALLPRSAVPYKCLNQLELQLRFLSVSTSCFFWDGEGEMQPQKL